MTNTEAALEAPGCPSGLEPAAGADIVDPAPFVRRKPDGTAYLELAVHGARCAGCIRKIESGLESLPGGVRARLNLSTGKLSVAWRDGALAPRRIVETLSALGYRAAPFDPEAAAMVFRSGVAITVLPLDVTRPEEVTGAIARIESEIAEANKILETLSRARGDLIGYQQSSNFRLVFLAKYVALTERNEVIAPALLELAAAVTGAINAGTVVEGLDGVLELAKKNSKITALSQTSLGGANDAFGKQWAAILLDHWSFDFIGWTADFVGITGDLPIATGNAKDVIIGDTIETLLAAGADALTTQSSLQTLKSLPGLRNFVSKLGSEAENFALVTGMKAVIASITEATSEGVMRDFNQELVTAVWFAGQYDLALRAGRGVEMAMAGGAHAVAAAGRFDARHHCRHRGLHHALTGFGADLVLMSLRIDEDQSDHGFTPGRRDATRRPRPDPGLRPAAPAARTGSAPSPASAVRN